MWDSLSREIKNKNNFDDANILEEIFEYFILQQNNRYSESLYKMLIPKIGEEYNPTKHMSVNGKNSGQIEKVIFSGYGSMEKKQSLIRVMRIESLAKSEKWLW